MSTKQTTGKDGAQRIVRKEQKRTGLDDDRRAGTDRLEKSTSVASDQSDGPALPAPVSKPMTTARKNTGVKLSDIGKPLGNTLPSSRVTRKTASSAQPASRRASAAAAAQLQPSGAADPGARKAALHVSDSGSDSDEAPAHLQYSQEQIAKDLAMVQQRRDMALKVPAGMLLPCILQPASIEHAFNPRPSALKTAPMTCHVCFLPVLACCTGLPQARGPLPLSVRIPTACTSGRPSTHPGCCSPGLPSPQAASAPLTLALLTCAADMCCWRCCGFRCRRAYQRRTLQQHSAARSA
jgi:hypothetical protein